MPITDVIRARSDHAAKERAAAALADMGLPISDAIRLLMLGVAGERRLPSEANAAKPMTVRTPSPNARPVKPRPSPTSRI